MEAKPLQSLLEDQESLWYNLSQGCACGELLLVQVLDSKDLNQELHYLKKGKMINIQVQKEQIHPSSAFLLDSSPQ